MQGKLCNSVLLYSCFTNSPDSKGPLRCLPPCSLPAWNQHLPCACCQHSIWCSTPLSISCSEWCLQWCLSTLYHTVAVAACATLCQLWWTRLAEDKKVTYERDTDHTDGADDCVGTQWRLLFFDAVCSSAAASICLRRPIEPHEQYYGGICVQFRHKNAQLLLQVLYFCGFLGVGYTRAGSFLPQNASDTNCNPQQAMLTPQQPCTPPNSTHYPLRTPPLFFLLPHCVVCSP